MEHYATISVIVIALTFAGYLPYLWDILKGKTKPHAFTWFIAALTAFIAYALQAFGGAGVGALPMFVVALICGVVFLLSIWKGTRDVTRSDVLFLSLALLALFLWFGADQPILSVILITLAEVLGYIPTARKSWNDPHSETLSLYTISAFRHTLAIFALEQLNILTVLYPAVWAMTNVVISFILITRRAALRNHQK